MEPSYQTSSTSLQSGLSERASAFYSGLEEMMRGQTNPGEWADKLNGSLIPLEYDLRRCDGYSQTLSGGFGTSRRSTRTTTSSWRRYEHPKRIRFLAQTVIKVLNNGAMGHLEMKLREYQRWHKALVHFNQVDRQGPRLSGNQLNLIPWASAAVLQPVIPPNAALDIIADYLIAKEANYQALMADILNDMKI